MGDILRLTKGETLKDLTERIYTRLNKTYQSSIKDIPYEIQFGKNILEETINYEILQDRRKLVSENNKKETIVINNKKTFYKKGDYIYKYKFPVNKMDSQWSGPYKVERIGGNNEWVETVENKNTSKVSTKNIRRESRM